MNFSSKDADLAGDGPLATPPRGEYNLDDLPPEAFGMGSPSAFNRKTTRMQNSPQIATKTTNFKSSLNSSPLRSPPKSPDNKFGEYNLDNLPPDAFGPIKGEYNLDNLPPDAFGTGNGDYNLNNLPADAFGAPVEEEQELLPKVLSLPLPSRPSRSDTEKDIGSEPAIPRDQAISAFTEFVGASLVKSLESKLWKKRLVAMNEIQSKLEPLQTLDKLADPIIRGLEKVPSWKEPNAVVMQVVIDVIRHVVVKTETLRKGTIYPALSLLSDKLVVLKSRAPAAELLTMIAEALCPSFVILALFDLTVDSKNQKLTAAALDVCCSIANTYGLGDLSIEDFLPNLKKALQSGNNDVRTKAVEITARIRQTMGQTIDDLLSDIPSQILTRIQNHETLGKPTKKFCRQRNVKGADQLAKLSENLPREKLSKFLSPSQISTALVAKKWAEQKQFFDDFDTALQQCQGRISASDLEPVFSVFKAYLGEGNKNLVLRTLSAIEQTVNACDKDIAKFIQYVVNGIVAAWGDQRINIREQASKTASVFAAYSGPVPFARAIASFSARFPSDYRVDVLKWLKPYISEIPSSDLEKLAGFIMLCVDDRQSTVRQLGLSIAVTLKSSCPSAFEAALKSLNPAAQRAIIAHFENEQHLPQEQPPAVKDVAAEKKGAKKAEPQKEGPKFPNPPTMQRKIKRVKGMSGKQKPSIEKAKAESVSVLPTNIHNKLFSQSQAEQLEALAELRNMMQADSASICNCSDVLLRWLIARAAEKPGRVVVEGAILVSSLYTEETPVMYGELEIALPTILSYTDGKNSASTDSLLDLLCSMRINADPAEYQMVLRGCIEGSSDPSLFHIFSELQLTVCDDPGNGDLFIEALSHFYSQSIEVVAACGGYLAALFNHMIEDEKTVLLSKLTPDQIDAVSTVIPVPAPEMPEEKFEGFGEGTADKILVLRKLISSPVESIKGYCSQILNEICGELTNQATDWEIIKLVFLVAHYLLDSCEVDQTDCNNLFRAVAFFSHRWQRKIVKMDGIPQIVNSMVYRLISRIPLPDVFSIILDGLRGLKTALNPESFYCKVWVVVVSQLPDLMKPGDSKKLQEIALDGQAGLPENDLKYRLCHALIATATNKKVAVLNPTPVKRRSELVIKATPKKPEEAEVKKKPTPTKSAVTPRKSPRLDSKQKTPVNTRNPPEIKEKVNVEAIKQHLSLLKAKRPEL